MAQKVIDTLTKKFGGDIVRTESQSGDEIAYVKRNKLVDIAKFLRDDPAMDFKAAVFCTCIDNLARDKDPRFEVCYQLRSHTHKHRIRLKVEVTEKDAKVPSLSGLWPAFNWLERETYDMYGIVFEGHPDLRRIYLYEEFEGYPLRKDYPKAGRQPLVRRNDRD
jgi:NADH-quinone oxidoreductase subunit C